MNYVNICFLGVFWYVRAEPTYCTRASGYNLELEGNIWLSLIRKARALKTLRKSDFEKSNLIEPIISVNFF